MPPKKRASPAALCRRARVVDLGRALGQPDLALVSVLSFPCRLVPIARMGAHPEHSAVARSARAGAALSAGLRSCLARLVAARPAAAHERARERRPAFANRRTV